MRDGNGAGRAQRIGATRVLPVLLAVVVLVVPTPAQAHTDLVGTSPEQGGRVASLPASAMLTFDTPLGDAVQVALRGPDGESAAASPTITGPTLEVPLTPRGPGTYEVFYRVTGADGHPVSGRLAFRADAAPVSGPGRHPTAGTGGTSRQGGPATGAAWWLVLLLPVAVVPARRRLAASRS